MKKLSIFHIIVTVVCVIGLIGAMITPEIGSLTLLNEVFTIFLLGSVTAMLIKGLLLMFKLKEIRNIKEIGEILLVFVLVLLCVFVTVTTFIKTTKDFVSGAEWVSISDCELQRSRLSRKFSVVKYYLKGKDCNGGSYKFSISEKDYNALQGVDEISVLCYKNTERIIEFKKVNESPFDKNDLISTVTSEYLIPNSYFEFIGTSAEESMQSIVELGSDYCYSAEVVSDGLKLKLTELQRAKLIIRNDDYIKEILTDFKEYNQKYTYKTDSAYQKIDFYFDENIPAVLQSKTILGVVSSYGLNYILLNNDADWNVEVTIYNCHTNKEVASVNVPNKSISFGEEEWNNSYNE